MLAALAAGWLALPGSVAGPESLFDELSKDFGAVPRGPVLTHYFHLTNTTGRTVKLGQVRVSCGCVSATVMQTELQAGQSTVLLAQMDTRRFSGFRSVTIYVPIEQPFQTEVRLTVSANARDDVAVTPESFSLGQVPRGKGGQSTVKVAVHGDPNFQITGATSESNYVQPAVKEVQRTATEVSYSVTATLRAEVPSGKWYTDVWLATNNAGSPKIRVPLVVEVEAAVMATPAVVQWDQPVAVGNKVERRVIVKGSQPFRILDVKGTDEQLSINAAEDGAKPVHILTFTIRPLTTGEFKRTLTIVTDLPEDGQLQIPARAHVQAK
jgi:hypothetical protein